MKEKLKINLSQKLKQSQMAHSLNLSNITRGASFDNEKQILINHKSSLETLLITIKNFQLEYLFKELNKNSFSKKQMLISLKDSLNLMLQEKNKRLYYIKKQYEDSKKEIQNKLFLFSQEKDKDEYNNKKLDKNKENSSIFEKNQLRLLNFQIQNEIEKTNFLIKLKTQINSYVKSIPFFFEINREIFCKINYEMDAKISEILNGKIRNIRKEFINVVKDKMEKNLAKESISLQIKYIKDNIGDFKLNGCKKYIETKDIIPEESIEYTKSIFTNQSKKNSLTNINNRVISEKKNNLNTNSSINKYNNNQKIRIIKDKLENNNIFYSNKINKDIFNDLNNNNKINQYLNMNINVNINLNNNNFIQNCFTSSSDSIHIDENNEKNKQYEMDLNDNNKIIITPIISNENIIELNNKNNSVNIDSSSDNYESFILDVNDK